MRAVLALALLTASAPAADDWFVDAAVRTGLLFTHESGAAGEHHMPEIMGSGVAVVDYDGDGDLDVFLVQGRGSDRLFRNLLAERGALAFEDVTVEAGLRPTDGFGMGVATGDIDNDGDIDLFVSRFGPDSLYRNNGDGTFADIGGSAGVADPAFGASATFFDYDGDGRLDLFVTRYNGYTPAGNKPCRDEAGERDYCSPLVYPPLPDRLYRNRGDGRFEDVTARAGVDQAFGAGLGVLAEDFDADGRPDLYLANDKSANQLWLNQGDGTFRDEALLAGLAYNVDGMAEAGMGVTAGDYDSDGDPDLFLTHIRAETNTLYRNDGGLLFEDATAAAGLAATSVAATGFGVQWFDADNDGDLDLFAANGAVRRPYAEPNQLFLNTGERFEDASARAGASVTQALVSRGAAFGDIDNDGDIDIVVSNRDAAVQLLLNRTGGRGLVVRLIGREGRDAHGARAALLRDGRPPLWRRVGTDGSYLSASDPRLHFGLGDGEVDALRVIWTDGSEERFAIPNGHSTLRRGDGSPAVAAP